jgi:hypothetical protein
MAKSNHSDADKSREIARAISLELGVPVIATNKAKQTCVKGWTELTPESSRKPGNMLLFGRGYFNVGIVLGGLGTIDCDHPWLLEDSTLF